MIDRLMQKVHCGNFTVEEKVTNCPFLNKLK